MMQQIENHILGQKLERDKERGKLLFQNLISIFDETVRQIFMLMTRTELADENVILQPYLEIHDEVRHSQILKGDIKLQGKFAMCKLEELFEIKVLAVEPLRSLYQNQQQIGFRFLLLDESNQFEVIYERQRLFHFSIVIKSGQLGFYGDIEIRPDLKYRSTTSLCSIDAMKQNKKSDFLPYFFHHW